MQWIVKASVMLVMVLSYAVMGQAAPSASQNPPTSQSRDQSPIAQSRYQAPVGHRQPKPSDLPAETQRNENSEGLPSSGTSDIDRKLRICRGC
jgi:hypothetical protein